MPRPCFDHFRFIAPLYDRFASALEIDTLAELLALPVPGLLLDVGGGTGRVAAQLRARTGGVVIADASRGMLRQTRRKNGLRAVNALAEALPFPNGQFERILIVDAFHHFHDHAQAVRELWRVLKPGGRLVVEEPNIERSLVKLVAFGEKLLLMRSRFFPAETMQQMFELYGAQVTLNLDDPLEIRLIADKP